MSDVKLYFQAICTKTDMQMKTDRAEINSQL